MTPHAPPFLCADLDPVGGQLGPEPEHFQVEELPAYAPSGDGQHWLVQLRKRGLNTTDMLRAVARAAGLRERDLGSAGMKDRHAVTSQWVSVPAQGRAPSEWQLPEGIELLEAARHDRKLRTGQLRGNRFRITLVGTHERARELAEPILERVAARGLPNYFGEQRFGRGGANLAEALAWLDQGGVSKGPRARLHRKLYPSVVQAEVFNRFLTERAELGLERLLGGDVVRLDGNRSLFLVESAEREQPRLDSGDVHLTGPMPGPKMKRAGDAVAELEAQAEAASGLTPARREVLHGLVDGTRRDLLVRPTDLALEAADGERLQLSFSLPAGCYATQLLRELTRSERLR